MKLSSLFSQRGHRAARRRRLQVRLTVELCEDRSVPSGVDVVSGDPKDWPMYNHDPEGSRYNSAETRLRPDNVSELGVVWRFETPGAIAGTPAVVNDVIYAADSTGTVYAVNRNGQELWQTHLPVSSPVPISLTASPLVTNRTLIIGDLTGQIHGLDTNTGEVRWTVRPPSPGPVFGDQHPLQSIFGSPTMVGNKVAIGISTIEEAAPSLFPGYPGFTFRGSLVLLDPADGHIIWQTYTVGEPTFQPEFGEFGPSGATIWSSPTYDRASNTIYATTGNNFSRPTTLTSDAIIAFDAKDGHIKWATQMTTDDFWNFNYPLLNPDDPPDFDFGDSPQIYKLAGRKVVGAGQKSGFYHVVDATTGEIINQYQASPGGALGGLYADSAAAKGVIYANGVDWDFPVATQYNGGSLTAIKGDGSGQLWNFQTPAPNMSGVAVANGVVYFSSIDGNFYAVNTANGTLLAQLDTSFQMGEATITGVSGGPAISRGRVYVGLGDTLSLVTNPSAVPAGGAILALGLPDSHELSAAAEGQGYNRRELVVRQVRPLLMEALRRWSSAGVDVSKLGAIDIRIADLGGTTLGRADGNTIWLDDDAAGWGWFVDRTPREDSEFIRNGNQGEQHRMDLLTVLEHEVGHLMGYEHEERGVMIDTLSAGTRCAPTLAAPWVDMAGVDRWIALSDSEWSVFHKRR